MFRSFLFRLVFYFGLASLCIIFIPSLLLPKKVVAFGGKLSGHWAALCLRIILSTNIELRGSENILKSGKFFIASTHQSEFETFYLQTLYNSPFFILKKELLKIPIFGLLLKKLGCISIDRNKINRENLNFFEDVETAINSNHNPLIIFPQGTRCKTKDRPNFKKGVERIYKLRNIKCQPVVMNSGDIWPKQGNLNPNKKIIVSVLTPIEPNLTDKNFAEMLQSKMYRELDEIL